MTPNIVYKITIKYNLYDKNYREKIYFLEGSPDEEENIIEKTKKELNNGEPVFINKIIIEKMKGEII